MRWSGMVWYGMVWYGMVWYGMVWCGMVQMVYTIECPTAHAWHDPGKLLQHAQMMQLAH